MKRISLLISIAYWALLPAVSRAQFNTFWLDAMFTEIMRVLMSAVPLLLVLGLLLFIWGAIKYFIIGGGDEISRAQGRMFMVYALIGLVAIVAVWGIVNLILIMLGIGVGGAPPLPALM